MSLRTLSLLPGADGRRFAQPLLGSTDANVIREEHEALVAVAAAACGVPAEDLSVDVLRGYLAVKRSERDVSV